MKASEGMSTAGKAALYIGGGLLALGAAIGIGVLLEKPAAASTSPSSNPSVVTLQPGTQTLSYSMQQGQAYSFALPAGGTWQSILTSNGTTVTPPAAGQNLTGTYQGGNVTWVVTWASGGSTNTTTITLVAAPATYNVTVGASTNNGTQTMNPNDVLMVAVPSPSAAPIQSSNNQVLTGQPAVQSVSTTTTQYTAVQAGTSTLTGTDASGNPWTYTVTVS
jgi:hypothetical protein